MITAIRSGNAIKVEEIGSFAFRIDSITIRYSHKCSGDKAIIKRSEDMVSMICLKCNQIIKREKEVTFSRKDLLTPDIEVK